jgi:hypothetical protein
LLILGAISWTIGCADIDFNGPEFPDPDWRWPNDTTGQVRVEWDWRNPIPVGQHIEIKGVSGDIRATTAVGGDAVVTATKIGRPDDVAAVSIAVVTHASGVTICAVYPDVVGRPPNECEPGEGGNMSVRGNAGGRVKVQFAVELPEGVDLIGRTLAGNIVATQLHSDVFAHTLAGDIHIATARLASARTQLGSVIATLGLRDWGRDLEFTTLSGDIRVTVPAATNAVVQATTQAGDITTDFPLSQSPGHIWGTLGSGGPKLTLSTLSGDVTLKRGG